MNHSISLLTGVVAICCSIAGATAATREQDTSGPRERWWHTAAIQKDLRLTSTQVRQLDTVFARDFSERLALRRQIVLKDRELQRLFEAGDADDATVLRCVTALEELRSRQSSRRTLMLLSMRKILTSDQRSRLTHIQQAASSPLP